MRKFSLHLVLLFGFVGASASDTGSYVWPAPPDEARIEYVGMIDCSKLSPQSGFFSKVKGLIAGRSDSDRIELPFDLVVKKNRIYMVCQNLPYLVEVDRGENTFKLRSNDQDPFIYPVSLCNGGDDVIFVTDSEGQCVFRNSNGKTEPFICSGLSRPTGIAALPDTGRLYVVDTGEHKLKIYDYAGTLLKTVPDEDAQFQFHYPTFASAASDGTILIADALNYKIRRFDIDGNLISSFGYEGDGPGAFSRPKGIATDIDSHVYVVDNLFDNFQIFDTSGQVLLAVGTGGREIGQFWSPSGICIVGDTIYVADTYNDRIQVLCYLGDDAR
jgi:DNA-binding beta-propeller fold protein YncE